MNTPTPSGTTRETSQACFTCDECNILSTTPGSCGICGEELAGKHLMSVEDGIALVCTCGEACTCTAVSEDDPTRCTCGEPVMEVSLEGQYICDCAPSCPDCSKISDKPGACECGRPRQQAV